MNSRMRAGGSWKQPVHQYICFIGRRYGVFMNASVVASYETGAISDVSNIVTCMRIFTDFCNNCNQLVACRGIEVFVHREKVWVRYARVTDNTRIEVQCRSWYLSSVALKLNIQNAWHTAVPSAERSDSVVALLLAGCTMEWLYFIHGLLFVTTEQLSKRYSGLCWSVESDTCVDGMRA